MGKLRLTERDRAVLALSAKERARAGKCPCAGTDEMCPCQNRIDDALDPARDGVRPTFCRWPPDAVSGADAEIYERIRSRIVKAHCAARRGAHLCCGRVTLDRSSMTLQCRLCGDLKLNTRDET